MKYMIFIVLLLPILANSQVQQRDVFAAGGGTVSNATYTNFETFGQPFGSFSANGSFKNSEGFLNAQNMLAVTTFVSSEYTTGTALWGYDHFDDMGILLQDCARGAVVHVSDYTHTGDIDMSGYTFIIDAQDFVQNGNLTGGLIRATNTGYLILSPTQNVPRIYPLTDGTNDLTLSITCLAAPLNPIKVKINAGRNVTGALSSNFWDIAGDNDLNATLAFNIPKTVLTGRPGLFRYWNGSRYLPIPQDRTSIQDFSTYYKVTLGAINQF